MSVTLAQFTKNMSELAWQFPMLIGEAIHDFEQQILKAQNEAFDRGENYAGERLVNKWTGSDRYSTMWAISRRLKGKQDKFFDLDYTGEFRASLQVMFLPNGKNFTVKVLPGSNQYGKYTDLKNMFGDILGISDDTAKELEQFLDRELTKKINQKLFTA